MPKKEKGSVLAVLSVVTGIIVILAWMVYIPFTFHEVLSLVCLGIVLPFSIILMILTLIFSLVSRKLGPGKRKGMANAGLVISILMFILWVGWIVFGILYNTNQIG